MITIGIPCKNAAQWLGAAIESALAQGDVEVIVVDDASTDRSRAIAEGYGVRVFDNPGRGAPAARNKVLAESRGEWVQYLDADDYLLPEKINRQLAEMTPGQVPYSPVIEEKWRDGAVVERRTPMIDLSLSIESQWILWQMPQTSGVLWPRDVLQQIGGWKESQPCCQEHELYLRAIRAGVSFCHTPSALAVYRLWSEETLCRRDPAQVIEVRAGLIGEMLDWLGNGLLPEHVAATQRVLFESARTLATRDMTAAVEFHDKWKQRGLLAPVGPAAPARYRLIYRILGFAFAERIARMTR